MKIALTLVLCLAMSGVVEACHNQVLVRAVAVNHCHDVVAAVDHCDDVVAVNQRLVRVAVVHPQVAVRNVRVVRNVQVKKVQKVRKVRVTRVQRVRQVNIQRIRGGHVSVSRVAIRV